jgi:hypothetical protein
MNRAIWVVAFFCALLLTSCCVRATKLSTSSERADPISILQAYDIALPVARRWRQGSYPTYASMQVGNTRSEPGVQTIRFQFIADERFGLLSWWDYIWIYVDARSGEIVAVDKGTLQTHGHFKYSSIHIGSARLDSTDALVLAESSGGNEFGDAHLCTNVGIELSRIGPDSFNPDVLYWTVTYATSSSECVEPESTISTLTLLIDARTGEVARTFRDGTIQ